MDSPNNHVKKMEGYDHTNLDLKTDEVAKYLNHSNGKLSDKSIPLPAAINLPKYLLNLFHNISTVSVAHGQITVF